MEMAPGGREAGDHDVKAGSAAWEAHERYYEERPHETRLPPARHHWARPPESWEQACDQCPTALSGLPSEAR
jgi:hypothetical protein